MLNIDLKSKKLIRENHQFNEEIVALTQALNQMKIMKKILMTWILKILNKRWIIKIKQVNNYNKLIFTINIILSFISLSTLFILKNFF